MVVSIRAIRATGFRVRVQRVGDIHGYPTLGIFPTYDVTWGISPTLWTPAVAGAIIVDTARGIYDGGDFPHLDPAIHGISVEPGPAPEGDLEDALEITFRFGLRHGARQCVRTWWYPAGRVWWAPVTGVRIAGGYGDSPVTVMVTGYPVFYACEGFLRPHTHVED